MFLPQNRFFQQNFSKPILEGNKAMGYQHGPIPAAGYQIHLPLDLESDSRTH